jgi:hypothetical protein
MCCGVAGNDQSGRITQDLVCVFWAANALFLVSRIDSMVVKAY